MNSNEYKKLQEAYSAVYMEEKNLNESMVGGKGLPMPTNQNIKRPTVSARKSLGADIEGFADRYVRPNVERIGAQVGAERANRVPGSNIPIIGDVIRNQGANQGRAQAGSLYDRAKQQIKDKDFSGAINTGRSVLDLLRNSYDQDNFDLVLEHLISEGYADTENAALVIMANMSEEWRRSILEEVDPQGNRSHDLFTGKPNPNYKPGNKVKEKPQVKKEPPMRDEPLW